MLLTVTLVAPLPAVLAHVRPGGFVFARLHVVGVTRSVRVLTGRLVYNERSQLQQLGTCALKVFTKNIANDTTILTGPWTLSRT